MINEFDFYKMILVPLLEQLYNKPFHIRVSTKNTIQVTILSKAIATFKLNTLNLANKKKKGKICIPKIIMDSNLQFQKSCLGGMIDTDFSLVFRHGKYPKITGAMPVENRRLKNQILDILDNLSIGYNCSVCTTTDERFNKKNYRSYKIDINGRENLHKWLSEVGFRSPKHIVKLKLWNKFGFCKPFLSYNQRQELLQNATLAQLVER